MSALRRMQQNGFSGHQHHAPILPGVIDTYLLASTTTEQEFLLIQRLDGRIVVVNKNDEVVQSTTIATLRATNTQVSLASLVSECLIEAPGGPATLTLEQSTLLRTHWICLRAGDILQFPTFAYNLTISYDQGSKGPLLHATVTSMRSGRSDSTFDDTGRKGVVEDNTDDDLDDGVPSAGSASVNNGLPSTRDLRQIVLPQDNEEEELFSTARAGVSQSAGQDAPSARERAISGTHVQQKDSKSVVEVSQTKSPTSMLGQDTESIPSAEIKEEDSRPPSQRSTSTAAMGTPRSSGRGKRKASTDAESPGPIRKSARPSKAPRTASSSKSVLLSGSKFKDDKAMANWLKKQGYEILDNVPDDGTGFVCVVGEGDLLYSIKLLRSLVLGQAVVTDSWLEESKAEGHILDTNKYTPPAVSSVLNRRQVFSGLTIIITPRLQKKYSTVSKFDDVKKLLLDAGAHKVEYRIPRKREELGNSKDKLFVAVDQKDERGKELALVSGVTVFHKDILTRSIIEGTLLTHDQSLMLNYGSFEA